MENDTNTSETSPTTPRPLGFWLRRVDALMAHEYATAFDAEGVNRRDAMLLRALAGTSALPPRIREKIERSGKRLRGLAERGWATETDGTWSLTPAGRDAAERLGTITDDLRERIASAVPPEDLATTTASLEAIARSLGWNDEMRMPRGPRPGFGRGRGFGPRFGRGFGPGFEPGFGPRPGFGRDGDPHGGWGDREDGSPTDRRGCGEGHRPHRHHRDEHGERAYERGFTAGFAARAGESAASVPPA